MNGSVTEFLVLIGLQENKPKKFDGVGLDTDDDGFYIKTHRCRSKSYNSLDDIPESVIDYIRSTG